MTDSLATILIFLPLAGAIIVWLFPVGRIAGPIALLFALAEIGFWITALGQMNFDKPGPEPNFNQQWSWFSDLGVSYHVGFYSFSFWLAGLAVVVMAAAIAYGFWVRRDRPSAYFGLMLFLTSAVVGVFASQDVLLFYVFFEAMMIPLYVLIGVWGGPGRLGATVKFVIYTMAGSLLMLASVIVFGLSEGSFDLVSTGTSTNTWVFLGFLVAFAVKAPIFPLHGWLPDAYRESSPEVSAVLSGLISKAAVFGLIRICLLKFPGPFDDWRNVVLALAAIGLVYGSLLAFRAPDVRGVIAYSSLAQMGLITIGIFATNASGISGAILQSVNHGLISATLFLLAGTIERRTSTGSFDRLGGMAHGRPALATVLMVTGIIALAVPGSGAFAGEFLILAGIFNTGWGWAVAGAAGIVLAAMYMLRLISAVLHRERGPAVHEAALDLRPAELAIVLPLIGCLLALSAWPAAISGNTLEGSSQIPALAKLQPSGSAHKRPNDQPPEGRMDFVTMGRGR
jgi:NADH-quinone oxidoreductase subunit M